MNTALALSVQEFASAYHHLTDAQLDCAWQWGDYDEGIRFAFFRVYETLRLLAARLSSQRANDPLSTAQVILGGYHAAYRDLQAVCLGVDDALAGVRPDPNSWSLRIVLAHIIDAEIGFWFTNSFALQQVRQGNPSPARPAEEDWQVLAGGEAFFQIAEEGPFSMLAAYHAGLHARILDTFAAVTTQELSAAIQFWESERHPLSYRLERFDSHLRQHTIQAEKTLASLGHAPNEARRLLRLIFQALAVVESAQIGAPGAEEEDLTRAAQEIDDYTAQVAAALSNCKS